MYKILGITILIFGVTSILATYRDLTPFWFNDENQKIETLWRQDIELLFRSGSLPKQISNISQVKIFPLSEETKELMTQIKHPFVINKEGLYTLEITTDNWIENNEQGILIQYNLVNNQNGNTIWELGRTISLK